MSENKVPLRKEQIALIEELALIHEKSGLQPAMAKILSLLTVSDELELTFDQIMETLGLSKSAISQSLNHLLAIKKISYKSKLGDRKRYFHLRIADWNEIAMESFSGIAATVNIYNKILAQRNSKTKDFNRSLQNITDFMALVYDELMTLPEKFKAERG